MTDANAEMSSNQNGRAKDPKESHPFGLDDILIEIGQIGLFQYMFFGLAFTTVLLPTIIRDGFFFNAGAVVYRCRIPGCDDSESSYKEPWTEFSIPRTASGQLDNCHRYQIINSTSEHEVCSAENYDQESKIDCGDDLIFRDEEKTISNDFSIFCDDEWKLAMVGTVNSVGQFVGMPFSGYFSDRFGRCRVLAYAGFISAVIGIARTFSANYYVFLFFGFLHNVFGSTLYGTTFVLALEILGPSIRVHACTMLPIFGALSRGLLALTAKHFKDWRIYELIFYIPCLGLIGLLWILPESFRWLLSRGEEEKATKILKRAARLNKRKLSDVSISKLLDANRLSLSASETKGNTLPLGDAFKVLPWRIINCSLCWLVNSFVSLGVSLSSASFGDNKFYSYMFVSLMEIPGNVIPSFTINRFGRKKSLFSYLFLAGICNAAMNFVSSDIKLILNLCAKMCITASYQVLFIFSSEIFPTNARSSLLSFCSMIGRFGTMMAPQTPLLAKYYASAPAILFAGSAFLSGSLVLFLPETKNSVLPTTLQEAKEIGHKQTKY